MREYIGFNPPFIGGNEKIMSQQRGEKLIRNDILQNLLIVPGELPFRPNFGTGIRNFVFDQMDQNALTILEDEIRRQIIANDPRLTIRDISLIPEPNESRLNINITISFIDDPSYNIEISRSINVRTTTA